MARGEQHGHSISGAPQPLHAWSWGRGRGRAAGEHTQHQGMTHPQLGQGGLEDRARGWSIGAPGEGRGQL